MVMLVMAGMEYMTSDLISSKEEAKSSIMNAILGLLILLGSVLILRTINPEILSSCLNDLPSAEMEIEAETETPAFYDSMVNSSINESDTGFTQAPSGVLTQCPEGTGEVTTFGKTKKGNTIKIIVCKKIIPNLQKLINQIYADEKLVLIGGGYRTYKLQEETRKNNCHCGGCTEQYRIYEMPSNQCNPPTARPGHSMHQQGLAVDFKCNGSAMTNHQNPCVKWLDRHAKEYGFYNLKSEPWHWSTNGR